MRWTIALGVLAAFVAGIAMPAQAGDTVTHTFVYNADDPSANGFTQFDGHVRAGRSGQTPAGYNDSNWSGGNSTQVWESSNGGTRMGIISLDGWEDDILPGVPIQEAYLNMHIRYNANAPGSEGTNQIVNAYPFVGDVEIGNGDGLVAPDLRWMTWEHRAASILDPEKGGVCDTCIGWGADGSGRDGPVAGEDYLLSPTAQSIVAPDFADVEAPAENRWKIDLTSIVQAWVAGTIPNDGILLWGEDANSDADPPTVNTRAYFHGADTPSSGFPGQVSDPRYLPEFVIMQVPEPATLGLLCLGGLVALRRTRR
jgi:hypothetical protein